ncbi:hypothetical protein GGD83_003055 [Rhodoblastus sphagnicola]|uniref:hypothetical protein n=1 Tax=Rhodoblastus sphagnicola TaxID=333368 RepID=UPI0011AFFF50|nr:hypothetical protein [Rhodoblastus sphagnicola]MBB4199241.1 hypothetical protein [Rhodoblastus sphagnicola]
MIIQFWSRVKRRPFRNDRDAPNCAPSSAWPHSEKQSCGFSPAGRNGSGGVIRNPNDPLLISYPVRAEFRFRLKEVRAILFPLIAKRSGRSRITGAAAVSHSARRVEVDSAGALAPITRHASRAYAGFFKARAARAGHGLGGMIADKAEGAGHG